MAIDASSSQPYPPAPRGDDADVLHGVTVPDPYRALEDEDDAGTQAWSKSQRVLFDEYRAGWPARPAFAERLAQLLRAGSVGTPVWRGDRVFHTRRTPDQEHAVLLTVDPDGTERALVDPVALDPSGATTLDGWQPSKEGGLLAYQLSEGGTEESVLRVLDVATGEVVDGPIDRARYSPVAWLPGGEAFYYVRRLPKGSVPAGEDQFHRRVYLHRLGTDPAGDVEIFGAGKDKTNYYGVSVSRDGRWLTVSAAQGTAPRNDVWIADLGGDGADAADPAAPRLRPVVVGQDAKTGLHVGRDGRLYVWTDLDAPRGRLAVTDPTTPEPEHWRDLLPEDPDAVLEDFALLDGAELDAPVLLASRTRHAVSEVTAHALATGEALHSLELPGIGSAGGLSERPEGGHEAWIAYTDHTVPVRILHYDARSRTVSTWADPPGLVDVPAVRSQQVVYRSKDGTEVRMVIVSPAGQADGPRPAVLYGYGGFNIALTPSYSASILAWVEAGGVWAVANLRGGSEEGEEWHRAGMREHKQNVFDDFAAAAEYLVAEGWTTHEQLAIFGGSNGGLLVGAALTQRPDLYRAVICSAPLLDMVRYEKFGLGESWNDEYGTAADPVELGWLLGYSPYHHVRDGVDYPSVLFTVFDGDSRVDTLHARKMAAALQAATSGDPATRPILLRAEANVGHGARAVSRTVDLSADQLGFVAAQLGLGVR
ncbi:prolyl oligopeptidase family serine peptidase [Jiangella alkaliphila]|uniref:prolyl oligopeptidase n=1 Tax=Jiangella alkaliphila TaxID=419479 RepID=A0A1H2LMM5_9ACTN|nr:prolyl oligopeptidase family serine peptidase [Jiangella alkaliphila]SDU82257.1 prolyl oligopeptidase [Jiangella alkaliphila]